MSQPENIDDSELRIQPMRVPESFPHNLPDSLLNKLSENEKFLYTSIGSIASAQRWLCDEMKKQNDVMRSYEPLWIRTRRWQQNVTIKATAYVSVIGIAWAIFGDWLKKVIFGADR